MEQLQQLQGQFPEFWSKQLSETTSLQSLLLAYSYVYGDALQKWQMIKNELSPFTIDAYKTEYYKIIDTKKTSEPSEYIDPTSFYYELPLGTFAIDIVSTNIEFNNSLDHHIVYDKVQLKTFIGIPAVQLLPTNRYLYLRKVDIDNDNVVNTYGALFLDIRPYFNLDIFAIYSEELYCDVINSEEYRDYLNNKKAQIINFIRCANEGSTLDSLEHIISVALDDPYILKDGIILDYDSNNTYVQYDDGTKASFQIPPKARFKQQGTRILAYEAIGECQVKMYSWHTDPARFTQALLCNNAELLFECLDLLPNEEPTALFFDMPNLVFDSSEGLNFFDFGIMDKPYNAYETNRDYSNPSQGLEHTYIDWTTPTLDNRIYQVLKNIIIVEIATEGGGAAEPGDPPPYTTWVKNILEYFRPLNSKYVYLDTNNGGGQYE